MPLIPLPDAEEKLCVGSVCEEMTVVGTEGVVEVNSESGILGTPGIVDTAVVPSIGSVGGFVVVANSGEAEVAAVLEVVSLVGIVISSVVVDSSVTTLTVGDAEVVTGAGRVSSHSAV